MDLLSLFEQLSSMTSSQATLSQLVAHAPDAIQEAFARNDSSLIKSSLSSHTYYADRTTVADCL